jgi:hypothetical protein
VKHYTKICSKSASVLYDSKVTFTAAFLFFSLELYYIQRKGEVRDESSHQ